ncbi:MAG: tRNA pseudouridine(55) synthase TruB [Pseudomonadales bacterium]|nr:tRNA pseudouridine(55) synthase TruB [Pseudomonadales bacterium]
MGQGRRQRGRNISGMIVVDKPQGVSSNACLQEVKRIFNASKAGHTGSLDPLATGVLPLCLGEATKVSQYLLEADKSYTTRIRLGVRTDTADSEGTVISERDASHVSRQDIVNLLPQFTGRINQLPPMYSALKHQGTPLYRLAREGREVERQPRAVTIYRLEMTDFMPQEFELEISCSKGTYIRTIADDLGEALGCGAHVIALRRLQAGGFTLANCVTMPALRAMRPEHTEEPDAFAALDKLLVGADQAVLQLPAVVLPQSTAWFIKQGQPVMVRHLPADGLVRLYEEQEFIGIGVILDDGRVAPRRLMTQ